MIPLEGVVVRFVGGSGGIVVDKAAKTAGELTELLAAEMTSRVGPTTLRRGVSLPLGGRRAIPLTNQTGLRTRPSGANCSPSGLEVFGRRCWTGFRDGTTCGIK